MKKVFVLFIVSMLVKIFLSAGGVMDYETFVINKKRKAILREIRKEIRKKIDNSNKFFGEYEYGKYEREYLIWNNEYIYIYLDNRNYKGLSRVTIQELTDNSFIQNKIEKYDLDTENWETYPPYYTKLDPQFLIVLLSFSFVN